jgi:hypothetical protein
MRGLNRKSKIHTARRESRPTRGVLRGLHKKSFRFVPTNVGGYESGDSSLIISVRRRVSKALAASGSSVPLIKIWIIFWP